VSLKERKLDSFHRYLEFRFFITGEKESALLGLGATNFESHWRRRREQKIVLKAGIKMPCESPARYANVSFSGSGIKAVGKRGNSFFFCFQTLFCVDSRPPHFALFSLLEFVLGEEKKGRCEGRQVAIVTWLIGAVRD
jgi:hypothetical protein